MIMFLFFFHLVAERHGWMTRQWLHLSYAAGGMFGGGVLGAALGYLVGGVGIAAMGTAIGLGGWVVIGAGTVIGVFFGGFLGSTLSILQFMRHPAEYDLSVWKLALLLLVCAVTYALAMRAASWALRRAVRAGRSDQIAGTLLD